MISNAGAVWRQERLQKEQAKVGDADIANICKSQDITRVPATWIMDPLVIWNIKQPSLHHGRSQGRAGAISGITLSQ